MCVWDSEKLTHQKENKKYSLLYQYIPLRINYLAICQNP